MGVPVRAIIEKVNDNTLMGQRISGFAATIGLPAYEGTDVKGYAFVTSKQSMRVTTGGGYVTVTMEDGSSSTLPLNLGTEQRFEGVDAYLLVESAQQAFARDTEAYARNEPQLRLIGDIVMAMPTLLEMGAPAAFTGPAQRLTTRQITGDLRRSGQRFVAYSDELAAAKGGGSTGFIRFADDVEQHVALRDFGVPRRNGIGGAHNLDEFMRYSNEFDIVSSTPHPSMSGINKIEYRLFAKDAQGNLTGTLQQRSHFKTVYDPAVISDSDMLTWGRQAAAQAQSAGPLSREWVGTAPNGLAFRGYLDNTGAVRTYFPDF